MPYKEIRDYGIIGDLETCALIGKDGSVDWMCLPYLDSPSVFAAILDFEKGGRFGIRPASGYDSSQRYLGTTNVLVTEFKTASGEAAITDFMPVRRKGADKNAFALVRKVECRGGRVRLAVSYMPRFDYGRETVAVEGAGGEIFAGKGAGALALQSPVPLSVAGGEAAGKADMEKGELLWFVLRHKSDPPLRDADCERLLNAALRYWRAWADICEGAACDVSMPWYGMVVRSGLVLKLLVNGETGAIAAAPTTSLPERIGGVRNWDYRFAWIRDSSFTDQALFHMGHDDEASGYRKWVERIIRHSGRPSEYKVFYGLRKGSVLREQTLDHLSGYKNSRPVRIGNKACEQDQHDIYGEMLNALYDTTRHGEELERDIWPAICSMVEYVRRIWGKEDYGIWEVRGSPRHFAHSKVMCWVALDRAIRIAVEKGWPAPVGEWKTAREEIRKAVMSRGVSRKLNSFVRVFDSEDLDATALLFSHTGFVQPGHPVMRGTIKAIMERLATGEGLVRRYTAGDGLPGDEGYFLLCSFWLVKALALSDRVEEAEEIFMKILNYATPLGLLAEEIDPGTGLQLGNFPQAFSHIGLINSALYLGRSKGRKYKGPSLVGTI